MSNFIKPIRTSADHAAALEEIDRLFGAAPGSPEMDRLEVLAVLVAEYERANHTGAVPDPVDVLNFAMTAQGRSQADLANVLGSRSRATEVLKRQRKLSASMIEKLSRAWNIPAALLAASYRVHSPLRRIVTKGAVALAIILALGAGVVGTTFFVYGRDLPSTANLADYHSSAVIKMDDVGKVVAYRKPIALNEIPPEIIKAFIAAEDQDFYNHAGYSLTAMARAASHNILASRGRQGGSTITQQLAKNLLLSGQDRTMSRKIKEVILARRIEQSLPKERILELYLNEIYFGGNLYGIGTASFYYFGKEPRDLTVAEAAYLAALPKAPNVYRLDVPENRERAKERRDWVLARMAADGLITATAAHFAQAEPLGGLK